MLDYTEARRFESAVVNLARQRGLDGDPFAERVPQVGSRYEEWAIRELYLDVRPRPHTEQAKQLIWKLARAIVMTRSSDLQPTRHTTMQQACLDHIDSIAGHEVPDTRLTWRRDDTPDRIKRARSTAR